MTNWKTYKLSEITLMRNGKKRPSNKGCYPVYGGNGIMDYADRFNAENTIIVGRVGAYCGNVYQCKGKCWVSDNAISVFAKEFVDSNFLYYLMTSLDFHHHHIGGAQPLMTQDIIGGFEISLPPLEEQKKIADILSAIDDKIENNRRINANLESQAQALFEEWLSKIPTAKGVFNDIIKTTIAGDWGQENKQGNYTHEVFCIRGADIPTLRNGDKGKMPTRYILERNYISKQLRANDIVIEISGGSPTQSTGRVCMVTQSLLKRLGKDLVCTNFCRAITPKDNYAIFIFLYWQMLYNKNTMFSYENGTTGIKNFNIADFISKEEIEIPSSNDVEELNEILRPMYNQIYANGLQNETLATLRDTLLPKLINGEIKL